MVHAIISSPFFATSERSLREVPWGCFSPRSHLLIRLGVTFKYAANTAWLAFSRTRSSRIFFGVIRSTGERHRTSNFRIVFRSMPPEANKSDAVSWIDFMILPRYVLGIFELLRLAVSRSSFRQSGVGPFPVRYSQEQHRRVPETPGAHPS